MAKFEEVAFGSCPALHAPRKDGAVLIATRVPLGDVRLQSWGWILTLSNQSNPAQDDIDTLSDRSGKRYPKVYYLQEVQNYAEQWACSEWELGYHQDDGTSWLAKSSGISGGSLMHEDVFQQALTELQARQEEQLVNFQNQLFTQVAVISTEVGTKNTKLCEELSDLTFNSHNRLLEQFRNALEDTSKQLSALRSETTGTQQMQETALNGIAQLTQKMQEDTHRGIDALRKDIGEQFRLVQDITRTEDAQTHQDSVKLSETVKESLQLGFDALSAHLIVLEENVGKIWDAVNPIIDIDADTTKTDINDVASTAANAAKKATSRIERMAANLSALSSSYYKNANEQSKRSFELARTISLIGGFILLVSIIGVFVSLFLQLGGATLIFNGVGALIAAIVEGIAGLNLVYDKATKQFTRSQVFLDRIQRSSMAYAIAENMPEEVAKQQTIEKIALDLIRVGEQMKENDIK